MKTSTHFKVAHILGFLALLSFLASNGMQAIAASRAVSRFSTAVGQGESLPELKEEIQGVTSELSGAGIWGAAGSLLAIVLFIIALFHHTTGMYKLARTIEDMESHNKASEPTP